MNSQNTLLRKFALCVASLAMVAGLSACANAAPQDSKTDELSQSFTLAVIGPNSDGEPAYYADPESYSVESDDAWGATQKSFDAYGLTYDASNTEYGVLLNSITSPVDGSVLAWDEASGMYWQLFVDGAAAEVGIDGVEVADGTSIVWYYSAFGDTLPAGELQAASSLANAA